MRCVMRMPWRRVRAEEAFSGTRSARACCCPDSSESMRWPTGANHAVQGGGLRADHPLLQRCRRVLCLQQSAVAQAHLLAGSRRYGGPHEAYEQFRVGLKARSVALDVLDPIHRGHKDIG